MDVTILNAGLALAMEFGENWLQPIQSRLAAKYPDLAAAELEAYNAACQKAMKSGHELVRSCMKKAGGVQQEAQRLFCDAITERYPWMDDANVAHLFSQGCYYAWKDGDFR